MDRLDAFHGLGHFTKFLRRAIAQPQTPTLPAVDEFVGPDPRTKEFSCGWFYLKKIGLFLIGEKVISTIDGFVADTDFRHVAKRLGTVLQHDVGSIAKIGIDVAGDAGDSAAILFFKDGFGRYGRKAEADDDDVDVGFAAGFAFPFERAIGKMDLDALGQKRRPKNAGLFALGDGVGGDERATDGGIGAHIVGGLEIPC